MLSHSISQSGMNPAIKIPCGLWDRDKIVSLLRFHRQLTFLSIAESLPEYDWPIAAWGIESVAGATPNPAMRHAVGL
jgi:hypothetical protein